ncbi:LCP family protein, partial [Candidatus Saccharibacteria bacterium]|nr:LCP family protein [Candidatus Saccharibacteria bacterium]
MAPTTDHPISSAEDFLSPTQAFNFDEATGELQASDTPIDHHATNSTNDTAADEPLTTNPTKPKKVKKPVSKKRKIITGIILAIVLLLIAGIVWLILWGNDIIAKITGGQGNVFDLVTFMEPTYERLKTDDNGRTNILAIGTSGYNMEGDEGNGVHDGAQLTDSIMVISLNQDTGDVAMLSLPRDLKASPTCTATGKINEVYWCNNMEGDNEQAGAEALMAEVGSILGIDFQYYAHLNWGSLVQIVDTLGGVTVTLDEDIEDYYYTGIVFEAGKPYTISGIEAVALARARHG